MDRRMIAAAAILVTLAAAGIYSFTAGGNGSPQGDYAKVLVLDMNITDGHVSAPEAAIRYGHPPATTLRAGSLTGTLFSADGRPVRTFTIWDPRVQIGDAVPDDGQGTISGVLRTDTSATLHLVLPYTGEEAGFRLTEKATGTPLAEANLSDAAASFAEAYPQDPAVAAAREQGRFRFPQDPQVLVLGTGILLFLALVLAGFVMAKGRGKE